MIFFNSIFDYFSTDPHKLLLWVGGTGGVLYWLNLFRYRVRVQVTNLKENYVNNNRIVFEAENLGQVNTSIKKEITLKALTAKRGSFYTTLTIITTDRLLPPCTPKSFEAEIERDDRLLSLFYKTYRFSFTRGYSKKYYVQSADEVELPFYKYCADKIKFKYFRKHPWIKENSDFR
jgi:hypothetical protein